MRDELPPEAKAKLAVWLLEDCRNPELYKAFLKGYNLGHDDARAPGSGGMDAAEHTEWMIEMFERRVEGDR